MPLTTPTANHGEDDFESESSVFRETVDEFVRRDVVPGLDGFRTERGLSQSVFQKAGDTGLLGVLAPENVGGSGLIDPRYGELLVRAALAIGATGAGLAFGLQSNAVVPSMIDRYVGQDGDDLLARIASGSTLVAIAGHTAAIAAKTVGSGLVLNGITHGVINAVNADRLLTIVHLEDAGTRVVLVSASAATVLPSAAALGGSDAGSRNVAFDGVLVEPDTILEGSGSAVEELLIDYGLVLSATCTAGARAAVAAAAAYAGERKVFGRPLTEFENTQSVFNDVWAQLTVAESYHGVCAKGRGARTSAPEVAAAVHCSFAVYDKATDCGLQLHGGYGYMLEYPIARMFADARFVGLLIDEMPALRRWLLAGMGLQGSLVGSAADGRGAGLKSGDLNA